MLNAEKVILYIAAIEGDWWFDTQLDNAQFKLKLLSRQVGYAQESGSPIDEEIQKIMGQKNNYVVRGDGYIDIWNKDEGLVDCVYPV